MNGMYELVKYGNLGLNFEFALSEIEKEVYIMQNRAWAFSIVNVG